MIQIRRAAERGRTRLPWLDSYHSFSFGEYYDPENMGFRALRVINDDYIAPGQGFGTHPHRDMEIITYVLEGALEHRDSLGTGSVIQPGEVQRMSAGTGIRHSEFNQSKDTPVHLLQIWILPGQVGIAPSYEQQSVPAAAHDGLALAASSDGRDGSVTVHQDVNLYAAQLKPGASVTHTIAPGRHAWLQVARGNVTLDGTKLAAGDGVAVSDEAKLALTADSDAEVLVFDLA